MVGDVGAAGSGAVVVVVVLWAGAVLVAGVVVV
jgi:hypothetical protein